MVGYVYPGQELRNELGRTAEHHGLPAALRLAEERVRSSPNDAYALAEMASILIRLGRLEEAHESARAARQLEPDDPEVRAMELSARQRLLGAQEGWDELEADARADNLTPMGWSLLGTTRFAVTGDASRGEDALRTGLRHYPEDPDLLSSLGFYLALYGHRPREALEILDRVEPPPLLRAAVMGARGVALCELGEMEQAIDPLTRAAEGAVTNETWWYYLGLALLSVGRYLEAQTIVDYALPRVRHPFLLRDLQAKLLSQLGHHEEAIAAARQVVQERPSADAYARLALVLDRANLGSEAREAAAHVAANPARLAPGLRDALLAQKLLKQE